MKLSLSTSLSGFTKSAVPFVAPTNVVATAGDRQVAITWDAFAGAGSYDVYRSETDVFASSATVTTNALGTSYDDTSAVPGTLYYYWVVAEVGAVDSGESLSDSGMAYLVLPPGNTFGIIVPSGTWTLGTLFFSGDTIPDSSALTYGPESYLFFSGDWYNSATFDLANDVSVTAGQTFGFNNAGGSNITIWN